MRTYKLFVFLLILSFSLPIKAQWKERANILIFAQKENEFHTTTNSQNVNIYVNYSLYKTLHWMIGPFGMWSLSGNENYSGYKGHVKEIGGGLSIGYYAPKFSDSSVAWYGADLGIKWNKDEGNVRTQYGLYNGIQTGPSFTASLGFNAWKKNITVPLPRIQIQLSGQFPLTQRKEGFWNGKPIPDQVWNRKFIELSVKQSLLNVPVGTSYLSPKIIGIYYHAQGNQENVVGIGLEGAFHKAYRDDYLSFNCLYEMSNYENRISFGAILNIPAFF